MAALSAGFVVDSDYEILESLGRGAASEVYRAHDRKNGREVALKILEKPHRGQSEAVARMMRECRLLQELDHPNSVRVLALGESAEGQRPYVAMELIRGRTLSDVVAADGPTPAPRLAVYLEQIASVLDAAHERGIVHRDIKPNNIMVDQSSDGTERIKVLDFGAAKVLHANPENATVVTTAGTTLGTPTTMSPEQAMGRNVDSRSDVYSLGITLFAVLTGRYPFDEKTNLKTMLAHVQSPVPRMSERNPKVKVPPAIERVVAWALEKEPANRPATAGALSLAFSKALMETLAEPAPARIESTPQPPPTAPARPAATADALELWLWALGLSVALVALIVVWFW